MNPQLDRRDWIFLGALFLAVLPLYAWNLNEPFVHHWETQGAMQSQTARNFLRFHLVPLDISGPTLDNYFDFSEHYYANRPPLFYILLSGSLALFGENEAAFRAPLILLTLVSLVALLGLMRSLVDRSTAWIATGLYAFVPLIAYYSMTNGQLPLGMIFILVMFVGYRSWRATRRRVWLVVLFSAQVLACMNDWPGYYAALVVALHHFWTTRRWKLSAALIGLNFLWFGGFLAYVHSIGALDVSTGAAKMRFFSGHPLTEQILAEGREIGMHMTVAVVLAALAGLVTLLRSWKDERSRFIFCLLAMGTDQLLFRGHLIVHDFLTYPLMPLFAASAAVGVAGLLRTRWPRVVRVGVVALLAAAFAGQTAIVMHSRLTKVAQNGLRYELAMAVAEVTDPEHKVLLITPPPVHYFAYYADRYVELYEQKTQSLRLSYMGLRKEEFSVERLLSEIEDGQLQFDWVVVPTREALMLGLPPYRALTEEKKREMDDFWHVSAPAPKILDRFQSYPRSTSRGFVLIRVMRRKP